MDIAFHDRMGLLSPFFPLISFKTAKSHTKDNSHRSQHRMVLCSDWNGGQHLLVQGSETRPNHSIPHLWMGRDLDDPTHRRFASDFHLHLFATLSERD